MCVDWTDLAQDRDQRVAAVDTVIQLRVSKSAENVLTIGEAAAFSVTALLFVSYNFVRETLG